MKLVCAKRRHNPSHSRTIHSTPHCMVFMQMTPYQFHVDNNFNTVDHVLYCARSFLSFQWILLQSIELNWIESSYLERNGFFFWNREKTTTKIWIHERHRTINMDTRIIGTTSLLHSWMIIVFMGCDNNLMPFFHYFFCRKIQRPHTDKHTHALAHRKIESV